MKKYLLVACIIFITTGCGMRTSSIVGYIVNIDNSSGKMVVVGSLQDSNMHPQAVNVSFNKHDISDLELGQKVKVTYKLPVNESYPIQAKGYKVDKVKSESNTKISLDDAAKLALDGTNKKTPGTWYIEKIELNKENNIWDIVVGDYIALDKQIPYSINANSGEIK